MPDNIIQISNLNKTYAGSKKTADKHALADVNLNIKQGSFFGLLGPNGAGKSTLINILAGLVVKTSGDVKINGHCIEQQLKQARQSIGIVPQELVLDPFFTVRETLEIFAGYYGVPKQQRRTEEILKAMALTDKADAKPRKLSGGMRRRLLIGKALVHNPDIIVLDEPTAGVDIELRQQLWDYVRQLNAKHGKTIVLTTHYLEEAEELCDEIAIINHGKIIAQDKKAKLLSDCNSKQIIVECNNAVNKAPASLAEYELQLDKTSITISYNPAEVQIAKILHDIDAAKLNIADIKTKEASLEDVFRQMVG